VKFRSRLFTMGLLAVIIQLLLLVGTYYWVIDPKIYLLEKKQVEKNLHRNLELLQRELFHLERLTQMLSQLPLITQLVSNTASFKMGTLILQKEMQAQELNLLYVLNKNKEVVWSEILDLNNGQPYPRQSFLANLWIKNARFFAHISTFNRQSGFYNSTLGPMLVVSTPITTPVSSEIIGSLITARLISQEMIQLIQSLTYTDLKLWPIGAESLNPTQRDIIHTLIQSETDFQVDQNGYLLRGYMGIPDLNQDPNLLISTTQPREFLQLMTASLSEIAFSLILFQVIFLSILSYFIHHYLLSPINEITTQLNQPSKPLKPLSIEGKPWQEVTGVITAISSFTSHQQTQHAHEISLAYRKGTKEAEQDLFKEIDEILKPLIAGLALTEQRLSNMPLHDLDWIIAESRSGRVSLAQLNELVLRLELINEKLHLYQKQTKNRLYELQTKALRNAAGLRAHSRSLESLRKFTPILGYNRKNHFNTNKT